MSEFVFLFRGLRAHRQTDGRTRQRWAAWIKDLDARGLVVHPGQPMANTGRLIESRGRNFQSTSLAEAKDTIDGFIVVAAHDLDEAVKITRGCPIFEEGGSIELRPVLRPQV